MATETKTVTIRNDFHGTEATIRTPEGLPHTLTASQQRRAVQSLCGMADCTCGTIRGPQDVHVREIDADGSLCLEEIR